MEMEKPSERMVYLFQSVAPGGPEAVERKMFGQPAATVHGHMFMGLFGDLFQVRLSDADGKQVLAAGATPFAPMGRTMAGYYVLPESILADREQLLSWIERAYANAAAFPAKEPKPRKAPARK
jgi:TfoX/Sxy family transcriptional regulator of competence genes